MKKIPIIVKFVYTTIGEKISQIRKKAKDSGISITESLIARRMEQLSKARQNRGCNKVWTIDDKILFKGN